MLDVTTGLRRSELFALKWLDVDFSNLTLDVQRSIYLGRIGSCKTEATTGYLPRPHVAGKQPFWPDIVLQKTIRPAALRAGIRKSIGWHTFRHTYSTLLSKRPVRAACMVC